MSTTPTGPLKGLRMIEMGQLLAGPFCGQLMGDFGCEVIKMLVKQSDFLLENFRPGTMEKWNLGFDKLSEINKGIIMIRVSGYGQTGPYAPKAGYAAVGEAMGGLRYVVGDPSTPPSRVGISLGDTIAATYACMGALMALEHRHKTGRGQVVDSAIYESVLQMMESLITEYDKVGYIRERTGSILPNVAPSNVYKAKDGDFLIAANQDSLFKRLAEIMGRPELAEDERYKTHTARGQHQGELDALINEWTKTKTVAELQELTDKAAVASGVLYRAPEMLKDPHFKAREAIIEVQDKALGALKMQSTFPKLSETPGGVQWTGPDLGQHNEEIYKGLLGMDDATYQDYKKRGII